MLEALLPSLRSSVELLAQSLSESLGGALSEECLALANFLNAVDVRAQLLELPLVPLASVLSSLGLLTWKDLLKLLGSDVSRVSVDAALVSGLEPLLSGFS